MLPLASQSVSFKKATHVATRSPVLAWSRVHLARSIHCVRNDDDDPLPYKLPLIQGLLPALTETFRGYHYLPLLPFHIIVGKDHQKDLFGINEI